MGAVRRPGRDSRTISPPPVLSGAQPCGKLLAQLAYGPFHHGIPGAITAIHHLRFQRHDRGTASWLHETIAADGLDDGPGCAARAHTATAPGMVTAERFERGAKPGRLLEQLLKPLFDATRDLFKARHSSPNLTHRTHRGSLVRNPSAGVEDHTTRQAAEHATHEQRRRQAAMGTAQQRHSQPARPADPAARQSP